MKMGSYNLSLLKYFIIIVVINLFSRELSNRVVTTDSSSFLKNSAAKPPIPTKINVTNGNKGEWTSANDNSKEIPVRNCYLYFSELI